MLRIHLLQYLTDSGAGTAPGSHRKWKLWKYWGLLFS
jgi:hypothetical protein